jgi:hypothetical protein
MRAAPAVSCAKGGKENAHEHTGQRRTSDIPCAMALRLMTRSPRGIGLSCPRRLRITGSSAPGRADSPSADLTPTIEASGPHDFTVRFSTARPARVVTAHGVYPALPTQSRARCRRVHHIPSQRSVTMANAPSSGTGCVSRRSDLPDGTSEILPVRLICRRWPPQSKNVENNPMQSNKASRGMDALSGLEPARPRSLPPARTKSLYQR